MENNQVFLQKLSPIPQFYHLIFKINHNFLDEITVHQRLLMNFDVNLQFNVKLFGRFNWIHSFFRLA
jgi:hypothetical protein